MRMRSVGEHGDQRPAGDDRCRPSLQTGGSCCSSTVESALSSRLNACCDAPTQQAEEARRQGSCCGAPAVPPADVPYGPAAYVTGTVETPVGAVRQVSRNMTIPFPQVPVSRE